MQFKPFKKYIKDVIKEGKRLQKRDLAGRVTTSKKYTHTQKAAFVIGVIGAFLLQPGFKENFAGYTISFLGIFIGLFTSINISLYEQRKFMIGNYNEQLDIDRVRSAKIKNFLIQFSGIISYAILLALILVVLLIPVLLFKQTNSDVSHYRFVRSFKEINIASTWAFIKASLLLIHRFFILNLLCNFFASTLYGITSYFSFLKSEYNGINVGEKSLTNQE